MDRETLDAMLKAMEESLPAFRRYLRKKGEILGHKNGLPFYDLFAPVAPKGYTPKTYTIEEAKENILKDFELEEVGDKITWIADNSKHYQYLIDMMGGGFLDDEDCQ